MKVSLVVITFVLCSQYGIYYTEAKDKNWIDYVYSPKDLLHLTNIEQDLFLIVKEYVAKLDSQPEYFFTRYIADYEESSLVAFNDWNRKIVKEDRFVLHTNPIWTYRMLWRFVTDLPKIKNVLSSKADSDILRAFENKVRSPLFVWPTKKDLNSAMDIFIDLHYVYSLNLTGFANEVIGNVVTKASLSAIHCFEISKYVLKTHKLYTLSTIWLKIAKKKHLNLNGHPILDNLETTAMSELFEDILKNIKDPRSQTNLYKYFNEMESEYILTPPQSSGKRNSTSRSPDDDFRIFSTLCKGGNLQSDKEKSELYCWHESKINPAWYINPQKMELHSKRPYIYQVHDFLGDDLIKYLKRQAVPIMEKSSVDFETDDQIDAKLKLKRIYDQPKTTTYAWLYEFQHQPRLPKLIQRIDHLTGLTTTWGKATPGTALQIVLYAPGAKLLPHVDPLEDYDWDNLWDGYATFMFYINDVEVGGNTVFTSAGVSIPPLKGSALFWHNVKYNGQVDYRAMHGGCPVLLGEKWIGNNVIHNNRNIFKRKCTLNEDD